MGRTKDNARPPRPERFRDVPKYLCRLMASFISRLFYIISLVWEASPGVLFLMWLGVGNQLTLRPHSERVVEILNAGSLDLPGTESAYNELPNYIKDVLGEEYLEEDQGPITTAVLPYIHAERVSIHGYFGKSAVTYKISAPDLENWLLNLDPTQVTSEQALLSLMEQYIPNAPRRSVEVTVEYDRQGIFSTDWYGNYYTREFTDAVCGGFNSAYSALYDQAFL